MSAPTRAPALECRGLTVAYGTHPALSGIDLSVGADDVVAVLGPSGSGKSTLLNAVAGFLQPVGGEVRLDGHRVARPGGGTPPEARSVGVVFQHYALWPHLTARETVAYPLRRRGVRAPEARRRAQDLLERMGIGELADRMPAELSGGQQQRVGLARALAREPAVYLFDEPTAHLDAALRIELIEELAERRRSAGAAALWATHDAGEALAVADRVVLLRAGTITQQGDARAVYEQPVDLWAARLTGPASVLEARVDGGDGEKVILTLAGHTVRVPGYRAPGTGARHVGALVRPEWASLGGALPATVRQVWYRGPHTDYRLETPAGEVQVRRAGAPAACAGQRATWDLHRVWLVAPPGGRGALP